MSKLPSKCCLACGRRFTWRKKWAADWEQVKFCSQRCKRSRLDASDQAIEDALRALLRGHPGKAVAVDHINTATPERVRNAARRLVAQGEAELVQRGRVVTPESARGPLQLRAKT